MDDPKFPILNCFYIEDEDAPGEYLIPVVEINGERVKLQNIKDSKLPMFKHIAGSMGDQMGQKAYFVEYEKPSSIQQLKKPECEHPHISGLIGEIMEMLKKGLGNVDVEIIRMKDEPTTTKKSLH